MHQQFQERTRFIESLSRRGGSTARAYLAAVALALASTLIALTAHRVVSHASLSLIFLLAVLIAAYYGGLGASLFAGLLSFLAFNFLFTSPYYTLEVGDESDLYTLLLFFLVAAITGNLAGRMHREVEERRTAARNLRNLNDFARRLAAASGDEQVARALAGQLAEEGGACVCLEDDDGNPVVAALAGAMDPPRDEDVRRWLVASSTAAEDEGDCAVFPIATERVRAVAVIAPSPQGETRRDLVRGMCDQAAVVLDRTRLESELEQARIVSETEQLRAALLSSVSHDLRTPLASIIGSTTSLIEYGDTIRPGDRIDLLNTVVTEARRLDRYIQNLLDMTRLGQGKLHLARDWVDLADVISSAVSRVRAGAGGVAIEVAIEPGLPLMWIHGVLIEQALVNLVDNAVKHSPSGTAVSVRAGRGAGAVVVEVIDRGPGIAAEEREKIFDMFYTIKRGDIGTQGTGLGLAICRGLVGAHGGEVRAGDGPDGIGTCMTITLPVVRPDNGAAS